MAWLFLGAFGALLAASGIFGFSLVWALLGGYVIFFTYGLVTGHRPAALWRMSREGVGTVGEILLLFLLIGVITALWRGAGTIPFLIDHAAGLISPEVFPLLAFLLCALLSFLTGTSFGTAATMGTVCMTMSAAMGVSPLLAAGAILSGSFFGDRCSPLSTSALLVAGVTQSDLYENLKGMMRTGLVPLLLTCLVYLLAGLAQGGGAAGADLLAPFAQGFRLHWVTVVPAAVVLLLAAFRRSVKLTMGCSILAAALLCVFLQGMGPGELVRAALLGYVPREEALKPLLTGGGVVSMAKPFCIVCISATFSGLFEGTGLLDGMKAATAKLAARLTEFGAMILVAVGACMLSCNQSLAIMLTHALCAGKRPAGEVALDLENTVVLIAPLIPWSIAGAVPLATIGAESAALPWACYLYLIPLWNLLAALFRRKKQRAA